VVVAINRRRDRQDKIKIKPVHPSRATTKAAADRLRGLQWVDDPERGPENK